MALADLVVVMNHGRIEQAARRAMCSTSRPRPSSPASWAATTCCRPRSRARTATAASSRSAPPALAAQRRHARRSIAIARPGDRRARSSTRLDGASSASTCAAACETPASTRRCRDSRFFANPVAPGEPFRSVVDARGRASSSDAFMMTNEAKQRRGQKMTCDTTNEDGLVRRTLLKGAAAARGPALGSGAITGFPTIWAQNNKNITLRQFGTGVSNLNAIAEKCKADLGITLADDGADSDAVVQRAVTQPDSFDIADIEYWMLQEGLPGRRPAADGCQQAQIFRQARADVQNRQADARQVSPRAPRRTRSASSRARLHQVRQGPDPMVHHDPDDLQRRHAGHTPRPGRPQDRPTGRTSSTRSSRARPRSSTSPRSTSWTPR